MTSFERIPAGRQLFPSEVQFFKETVALDLDAVVARYRAAFPHSGRSDGAVETHAKNYRTLLTPAPRTPSAPKTATGSGQKYRRSTSIPFQGNRYIVTLSTVGESRGNLSVHIDGADYPIIPSRTVSFPVTETELQDRDPDSPVTVLQIWRGKLESARKNLTWFESLWTTAALPSTPAEIARDATKIAAYRKAKPYPLIQEIREAFEQRMQEHPDDETWNTKRMFEMGLLDQIEPWLQLTDEYITKYGGTPPETSPPEGPAPDTPAPLEQIGTAVTVGDLEIFATAIDKKMYLVVSGNGQHPLLATPTNRVLAFICSAEDIGGDLFDPITVLGIWIRKLKHARQGIPTFEAVWVAALKNTEYDLLPAQVLQLRAKGFLPEKVVADEILPAVEAHADFKYEYRGKWPGKLLFLDAALAAFKVGVYPDLDGAIAHAQQAIAQIQKEREEAAARETSAATSPSPAPPTPIGPSEGSYPKVLVANFGAFVVRYQAVEVLPVGRSADHPPECAPSGQ